MILVDNSKQCSAILRFIAQPALESCPEPVRQVFDASRFSEFHTFLDGVMNVWVGLGDEETLTLTHVKSAAAIGAKMMRQLKQREYQIEASGIIDLYGIDSVYDLCTGIELGLYQYEGCYSNAKEKYSYTAFLQGFEDQHQPEIQELVNKSVVVAQNVMMARDWVNMPGNLLNPVALAKHVVEAGKEAGCEVKVVDVEQAKKLGMNLFLSVGLSSDYPCSIAVLRYMGDPDDGEVTALVGKGVTLDTGGYNLKTKQGLLNTKGDMGGAAAVTAAICALAKNKAKTNVVAVVPIVENRLSNTSSVPGDVYTAMNGKTVEILSADAEGRLILADAITYAVRVEKADRQGCRSGQLHPHRLWKHCRWTFPARICGGSSLAPSGHRRCIPCGQPGLPLPVGRCNRRLRRDHVLFAGSPFYCCRPLLKRGVCHEKTTVGMLCRLC